MIEQLYSEELLERDKCFNQIEEVFNSNDVDKKRSLQEELEKYVEETATGILDGKELSWGVKQCGLKVRRLLLKHAGGPESAVFQRRCCEIAIHHLSDKEARVRCAAGDLLGSLCGLAHGTDTYAQAGPILAQLLKGKLSESKAEANKLDDVDIKNRFASVQQDDGTSRYIETWLRCLQQMISGCGNDFLKFLDADLIQDVVKEAIQNNSRFIRESGFHLLTVIIADAMSTGTVGGVDPASDAARSTDENMDDATSLDALERFGVEFSSLIGAGLSDNWSQVRLAALVAARALLTTLPSETRKEAPYYPHLLPRMCLNRYYITDGVKYTAQNTWIQILGSKGRDTLEAYIVQTVDYYLESVQGSNEAARESACQCIGELAAKIRPSVLQPYVCRLLSSLAQRMECDLAWPVRDFACVAAGSYFRSFPQESKSLLDRVLPLFLAHLQDTNPSVREGAALALANAVKGVGQDLLVILSDHMVETWSNVKDQPSQCASPANQPHSHHCAASLVSMETSDCSTGISSGEQHDLEPNSPLRRQSEPWEGADGSFHLLGELALDPENQAAVEQLLTDAARSCDHKHYSQHLTYFQTVCVRLSVIAKNIAKSVLKSHLEEFFDAIFYALESDNSGASYAGETCILTLSSILGPNILRGRIEMYNPRYLISYNRLVPENAPIGRQLSISGGRSPGIHGESFSPPHHFRPSSLEGGFRSAPVMIPGASGRRSRPSSPIPPSLGGTPT